MLLTRKTEGLGEKRCPSVTLSSTNPTRARRSQEYLLRMFLEVGESWLASL